MIGREEVISTLDLLAAREEVECRAIRSGEFSTSEGSTNNAGIS